jgi:AP-1 complex subunit mu
VQPERLIRNEIIGEVSLTIYLSAMPELRIGMNDKILFSQDLGNAQTDVSRTAFELEDIKFHEHVKIS